MEISFSIKSDAVEKWLDQFPEQVKKAVGKAMAKEGKQMQSAIQSHVASRLNVLRRGFLNNFRVATMSRGNDLPSLQVYSKVGWAAAHNFGLTINGKMLIPINGRVGRKRFKAQIAELMRGGNAYFVKNAKGNVVLMAENIKEHDRPLAGFKRRYRKAEGIKRLKRGADIPIAILVTKVTIPKRLDIEGVVESRLPMLCTSIDKELVAVLS